LLGADRPRGGGGGLFFDLLNKGAPTARERASADATLELLGITDIADLPVEALSLGHGRLVELGRALATEPKLLMLDEPSSGLDRQETSALAAILTQASAERSTALLLVEHDLEMVHMVTS